MPRSCASSNAVPCTLWQSPTVRMLLRSAILWHVFALTKSPFHLGLIGVVQFVPALGLMLVGGALADTHDRRRIMMTAQCTALVEQVVSVGSSGTGRAAIRGRTVTSTGTPDRDVVKLRCLATP